MTGLSSQLTQPPGVSPPIGGSRFPLSLLVFLWAPFATMIHRRELIVSLARRRLATRYKGSLLGPFWALLVPLILLGVYVFVFGIVLQAKWGMSEDDVGSYAGFAVRLFSGLLVFNLFRECLIGSPRLVRSNAVFVKRVVFPLETLPWVVFLEACVGLVLGLVALGGFVLFVEGTPPATALMIPILILPIIPVCIAVLYLVSALGVYLRDTDQVVGVLAGVLMFLSPIFYPIERVPEPFRSVVRANPMTEIITWVRGALFEGTMPPWHHVVIYTLIASLLCAVSHAVFMRAKRGFADVL